MVPPMPAETPPGPEVGVPPVPAETPPGQVVARVRFLTRFAGWCRGPGPDPRAGGASLDDDLSQRAAVLELVDGLPSIAR
jgi:hypothetical protein